MCSTSLPFNEPCCIKRSCTNCGVETLLDKVRHLSIHLKGEALNWCHSEQEEEVGLGNSLINIRHTYNNHQGFDAQVSLPQICSAMASTYL